METFTRASMLEEKRDNWICQIVVSVIVGEKERNQFREELNDNPVDIDEKIAPSSLRDYVYGIDAEESV